MGFRVEHFGAEGPLGLKLLTPVCEESRFVFPLSRPHMTDQSLKGLFEAFRGFGV